MTYLPDTACDRLSHGEVVHSQAESASTTVHFGYPSGAMTWTAYLAQRRITRVAGGFTIDGLGGWFVDRIEGDPSNVVGLSLPLLRKLLELSGVSVAALWSETIVGR